MIFVITVGMLIQQFLSLNFSSLYLFYIPSVFQFELPLEEFDGKLNKSKLKLVLTNGKIQGYVSQIFVSGCVIAMFGFLPADHLVVARRTAAVMVQEALETTNILPWKDLACPTWSLRMSCRLMRPLLHDVSLQVRARKRN